MSAKPSASIVNMSDAPKTVKSQIQGDELRVSSKSRDDLQNTIQLLKGEEFDVPLQYINFR